VARFATWWIKGTPEEAGFFLVAWMLDVLTDEQAEAGLRETVSGK